MNLRTMCRSILMNEVFIPLKKHREWKVLVVDKIALKVIASCCSTEDILRENIAYIEMIDEPREEFPLFEAIYILYPFPKSVDILISDFLPNKQCFISAHVFTLLSIPPILFDTIAGSAVSANILTLKELNLAFLPYESQVFSLDEYEIFSTIYNKSDLLSFRQCDDIAERLATLFATLGQYPVIRFRKSLVFNRTLAESVKTKLDDHYHRFPSQSPEKAYLLILDRGFDPISPLLHELTLQAMVHDILPIQFNTYRCGRYTTALGNVVDRDISLDENDEFFTEYRHKHVADVANTITEVLQKYKLEREDGDTSPPSEASQARRMSREVQNVMKLRLKRKYADYRHMVAECVERFASKLKDLCLLEQDLANRVTEKYLPITDPSLRVADFLLRDTHTNLEKLRLLILYIFYSDGVSHQYLSSLVQEAGLTKSDYQAILNLSQLGCHIIKTIKTPTYDSILRRDRSGEVFYKVSRWTPLLKDIIELFIAGQLDKHSFPFHVSSSAMTTPAPVTSFFEQQPNHLVVFVLGGISYSEMRCAYEVTKSQSGWHITIGSDHLTTPTMFLQDVHSLSQP